MITILYHVVRTSYSLGLEGVGNKFIVDLHKFLVDFLVIFGILVPGKNYECYSC